MIEAYKVDDTHIVLSTDAWKLHLAADAIRKRVADDRVALAESAQEWAEQVARDAVARAARASWWAEYGFWVGVGVTLVTVGAIAGALAWVLR